MTLWLAACAAVGIGCTMIQSLVRPHPSGTHGCMPSHDTHG